MAYTREQARRNQDAIIKARKTPFDTEGIRAILSKVLAGSWNEEENGTRIEIS